MRFLPVVERELRVAARKVATHRSRFLAALAASFIIGGMVFFFQSTRPPAELGRNTFGILSFLLTWFCIIGGLIATFDTLSEEKRQGTISLLFLTPLNNLDLILGKLAGATLTVAFGVIAATPILAITLAMGGVTLGEIWRLLLSLLTILFFSSSAGLLVSSLHENASKSFLYSIAFVIAWLAVVGFGDWILSVVLTQSISPLAFLNPTTLPRFSRDASFSIAPERFWQTLMCVSAAGSIFLVAATRIMVRALAIETWRRLRERADARDNGTSQDTGTEAGCLARHTGHGSSQPASVGSDSCDDRDGRPLARNLVDQQLISSGPGHRDRILRESPAEILGRRRGLPIVQ